MALGKKTSYEGIENDAYILGKVDREVCRGVHKGINQILVVVDDLRDIGKPCKVMIMLPDCESTHKIIEEKLVIEVRGVLGASKGFNPIEKNHVFIDPEKVKIVEDDIKKESSEEFYLNYTLYNRVILTGKIIETPKLVDEGNGVLRIIKLSFDTGSGTKKIIRCVLWGSVDESIELNAGDRVQVIGSMSTSRISYEGDEVYSTNTGERLFTRHNLVVQKVIDLDNTPERHAESIYI